MLSHGWPLNADSWEIQALFLASQGDRVITHDRRGHGRSSQPWNGNEMDTYADDLATLIETLDLNGITLIGFSTGASKRIDASITKHLAAERAAVVVN
ncbi:alpha/beta fold hydrolase [Nostoc sp.]|uniref:alpha/beta fold hydrolase n=1 Tax=Nostoc sp. TaxID=1180 RepID=UPI002FFC5115